MVYRFICFPVFHFFAFFANNPVYLAVNFTAGSSSHRINLDKKALLKKIIF